MKELQWDKVQDSPELWEAVAGSGVKFVIEADILNCILGEYVGNEYCWISNAEYPEGTPPPIDTFKELAEFLYNSNSKYA